MKKLAVMVDDKKYYVFCRSMNSIGKITKNALIVTEDKRKAVPASDKEYFERYFPQYKYTVE